MEKAKGDRGTARAKEKALRKRFGRSGQRGQRRALGREKTGGFRHPLHNKAKAQEVGEVLGSNERVGPEDLAIK
jgi:hypothetical protein